MEIITSPETPMSLSRPLSQQHYFTKSLPQLPLASPQRLKTQARNATDVKLNLFSSQNSTSLFPEHYSLQPRTSPQMGPGKSMRSQLNEAYPAPTLTTSSRKIIQMTNYDPNVETSMQEEHHLPRTSVSLSSLESVNPKPISEQSSGCSYSQPEAKEIYENEPASYSWASLSPGEISPQISPMAPISLLSPITPSYITQLSLPQPPQVHKPVRYIAPHRALALDSGSRASDKDFLTKLHLEEGKPESKLERPTLRPQQNLGETRNLREILYQEHTQQEERSSKKTNIQDRQEFTERLAINGHLIPRPLELRPKHKPEHITVETKSHIETKPQIYQNVGDSFRLGVKGWTSSQEAGKLLYRCNHHPSRSSSDGTSVPPISVVGKMLSDFLKLPNMLPPPIPAKSTKRKNFDTGKHPLRSPFPSSTHKSPDSPASPAGKKFRKRFSGAMKHLPELASPITKKDYIPNSSRSSNGPDTPHPDHAGISAPWTKKEAFHRGKENIHEVITRAKNAIRYKSANEKRRENLKKNIVVVGITDQSPGT